MSYPTIQGNTYYDFTGETMHINGVIVHQIVATKDVSPEVPKGTIGGYIQSRDNLTGGAWVSHSSVIMGKAILDNYATASGSCLIEGNSFISGSVSISGSADIFGSSLILGGTGEHGGVISITDGATIGNATIIAAPRGSIIIDKNAIVEEGSTIIGVRVHITDFATVTGYSLLEGAVNVRGYAKVLGGAHIVWSDWHYPVIVNGNEHVNGGLRMTP